MGALRLISLISLAASFVCAAVILIDILAGRRQKMAIMNWVWPITGVWAGPLGLAAYYRFGRASDEKKPFWQSVAVGDSHCAAGCTLGDVLAESLVFLTGFSIAGSVLWASFTVDFFLAYLFGVIFQYFSIAPMRNISGWPAIVAAVKADTVSLVAFEIGMFVWMGFTHSIFHPTLKPDGPVFWFMMQIAMLVGYATAYPANWWLIRKGVKEEM